MSTEEGSEHPKAAERTQETEGAARVADVTV